MCVCLYMYTYTHIRVRVIILIMMNYTLLKSGVNSSLHLVVVSILGLYTEEMKLQSGKCQALIIVTLYCLTFI